MTARTSTLIGAYIDRETDRHFAEQCRLARQGQDIPLEPQFPRAHLSAMNDDAPVWRPSVAVWVMVAATWPLAAWGVAEVVRFFGGMW